jgi:hypothetical protein
MLLESNSFIVYDVLTVSPILSRRLSLGHLYVSICLYESSFYVTTPMFLCRCELMSPVSVILE